LISKYMSKVFISVDNISRVFFQGSQQIEALHSVSLEIQEGEFVAIMGPSGSGKSTLLSILGCLDFPSSGRYFFDGRDVSGLSDTEASRLRASQIGFVFQTFNLVPRLSVQENIRLPFLYANIPNNEISERVKAAIHRVDLNHRADHLASNLSGGEMQRVAIARSLVTRPRLILADEPTGNLDTKTSKQILLYLQDINREGNSLIIVTHDKAVAQFAKRVIMLRDGSIEGEEVH
jgi:putative ABC transport system ATP-binding protein